eukprot:scaffold15769_cov125-Isochrysis_galbana.AAC.8
MGRVARIHTYSRVEIECHTATLPTATASVPHSNRRACSQLARFARKRKCIYIAVRCCATVECRRRCDIALARSTAERTLETGGGTMRQTMAKRRSGEAATKPQQLSAVTNFDHSQPTSPSAAAHAYLTQGQGPRARASRLPAVPLCKTVRPKRKRATEATADAIV